MTENEVSKHVLEACIRVHTELGPGLLETVYEQALFMELQHRGLHVERQVPIPATYRGVKLDQGFRADVVVERCVIVEIKSVETLAPVASMVLLTYLRMSGMKLGLLVNFHHEKVVDGFRRVVNGLDER